MHIGRVEPADDTWPSPQPIPASTRDGQAMVADGQPLYPPTAACEEPPLDGKSIQRGLVYRQDRSQVSA